MDRKLMRSGVALLAVVSLLPLPVLAQDQSGNAPAAPEPNSTQPDSQAAPSGAVPPRTVDLKLDYSAGKKWFPGIVGPYTPVKSGEPTLTINAAVEGMMPASSPWSVAPKCRMASTRSAARIA